MSTVTRRLIARAEEPLRRLGHAIHPRLSGDGLAGLDPDVARAVAAAGPLDSSRLPVPLMRAGYRLQTTVWNGPRETAVRVEDERVNDQLVIRTYTPHREQGGGLVYFHGGGMMIGDLDTHDRWCRFIAVRAGVVVHAVDYRRAPEHPFPAGCVDALVGWNHVVAGWRAQGRPLDRLGVGGDSAGGYLSVVVATQAVAPTLGAPVAARPGFVWALYPAVDATRRHEQFGLFPSGVLFTGHVAARFSDGWLGADDDAGGPLHSPGLVDDEVLAGTPPTHLVTCEFDPLTPECLRFLERLRQVGVDVSHDHFDDLPHEFISMTGVSRAASQAAERVVDAMARMASRMA